MQPAARLRRRRSRTERRRLALGLVVWCVVGCKAGTDPDDFPVNPGGNGGNGSGVERDASLDAPDDGSTNGSTISGRVCVLLDFRDRTTCANGGLENLTVTLGNESALTDANGFFTIARATGTNLVWRAAGAAIVPSVVPFSSDASIPAIAVASYDELRSANGEQPLAPGQGSLVVRTVQNDAPLAGATASLGVAQNGITFYDGNSALAWDQDATGAYGVGWMPTEIVGPYTLTVTPALGSAVTQSVAIEEGAITFVVVDVP